jgi:hypothetical protein
MSILSKDLKELKKDYNRIVNRNGIYKNLSAKDRKELSAVARETIKTLEAILFFENDLRI